MSSTKLGQLQRQEQVGGGELCMKPGLKLEHPTALSGLVALNALI